jgi:hypothetical protein
MTTLWVAIAPGSTSTRVLVMRSGQALLKAQFAREPSSPHAMQLLLEAIAMWEGHAVRAALVVDECSPQIDLEALHGGFPPRDRTALYSLEWVSASRLRVRDELRGMCRFDDLADVLAAEAMR